MQIMSKVIMSWTLQANYVLTINQIDSIESSTTHSNHPESAI